MEHNANLLVATSVNPPARRGGAVAGARCGPATARLGRGHSTVCRGSLPSFRDCQVMPAGPSSSRSGRRLLRVDNLAETPGDSGRYEPVPWERRLSEPSHRKVAVWRPLSGPHCALPSIAAPPGCAPAGATAASATLLDDTLYDLHPSCQCRSESRRPGSASVRRCTAPRGLSSPGGAVPPIGSPARALLSVAATGTA